MSSDGCSAGVSLTLGGNAAVLIRGGGRSVVTDPWLGDRIGPWRRLRPAGIREAEVAGADAILISHAHPDHLDPRSLAGVPRHRPILSPAGAPLRRLRRAGFEGAVGLADWEEWRLGELRVVALPCVHTRWSHGFLIELCGRRIYFAGDAAPRTPFAEIARRCGPLDVALLPVGGSSVAPARFQRHLTPALAAEAAAALRPRIVIPIHWGHVPCVPAFLDRFRGTAPEFIALMERRGGETALLCPSEGEPVTIPAG